MSIGTLDVGVVLDKPDKVYCGHRDEVLGHISLSYASGGKDSSTKLSGPLQIYVTLHGQSKTEIRTSEHVFCGQAQLLYRTAIFYSETFRAHTGSVSIFPFTLNFPEVIDDTPASSYTPPPSFHDSSNVDGVYKFEASIEYHVGVRVDMPQTQVYMTPPTKYSKTVIHYKATEASQPREEAPFSWHGLVAVSSKLLLPEADRLIDFRRKSEALSDEWKFPTYAFDWECSAPRDLYLGQPAHFQLCIRPRKWECTASLVPEVRLKYFRIEIQG
ncbi:hypothetical protein F5Y14DRAFT_461936 [Nemania sp. NC0429]|nr:hypothetical protein F5Y14DRAFT_461936 [Nemania sp. NC0429]